MKTPAFKQQILFTVITVVGVLLILLLLRTFVDDARNYVIFSWRDSMMRMDEVAGETFDQTVKIAKIALWMILVFAVARSFNALIFGAAFRRGEASGLLRNAFSIAVYAVAFLIIFKSQYPTVDLAALFTTSAIVGVILGLALQDTLGNLFAGLSMQADQPFVIGDVVNIPNKGAGVIENITWRGVKIRTFQNKLLIISNSALGKESIEVAPRDNLNARIVYFSTLQSVSPTKTMFVVREAVADAENVSTKIKPIVRIRELADHGIDWEVKYWIDDYAKYNDTDALVRKLIWYAFLREDIGFAHPTQTVFLEKRSSKIKIKTEGDIGKVFERLSAIEIFEPLSDDETMQLARDAEPRVFAPGETIIKTGEPGATMFVINHGAVKIQVPDNSNDKLTTLATLHEGRFFGEMALLTGAPRSATVIAVEETEVFEIGHGAAKNLLKSNPFLAEALSKAIAERQMALSELAEAHTDDAMKHETAGIFAAVKRFFGLN